MKKCNRFPLWFRVVRWALPVGMAFMAVGVSGEILHLNDGTKVEGVVKRNGDGYDVTDASGKLIHVAAEDVKRIEIGSKVAGVVETESRLQSLRRSVENLSDIKAIIDRYTRFIDQNKDSPITKEAELDLAAWRDRRDKGMVKVGPRWVTTAERDVLKEKGVITAGLARRLMLQGRMKDAEPVLQEALDEDPGNVSAAYLRGYLLFKQEQLPGARKWFESVVAAMSDHAPTLNNLAVVHWRQNQPLPALNYYVQAMLASPLNKEVLNNVAEALNALPQAQRTTTPAKKAFQIFADQDTQLQQKMAESGQYRWGATWVDKAKFEKLQAIERDVQKQLDKMSADFDAIRKKIAGIESDIDSNARRMKSMEETSYTRDAQGNIFRLPLPSRYYDLERENKQLAADRDAEIAKLDALRTAAKLVQQQMPTPKFTSVQQLIGLEGAPLLPPIKTTETTPAAPRPDLAPPKDIIVGPPPGPGTAPATQPATRPAPAGKVPDSLLAPS